MYCIVVLLLIWKFFFNKDISWIWLYIIILYVDILNLILMKKHFQPVSISPNLKQMQWMFPQQLIISAVMTEKQFVVTKYCLSCC